MSRAYNIGCLSVEIENKGGINATAERRGGINCFVSRIGGIIARAIRYGGIDARATRKGGISVNLGLVCSSGLDTFEVLWASDGPLLTIDNGYLITQK